MHSQKKNILLNVCLEKCKEGILFLDIEERNFPLFAKSESIAKNLQVDIWLETSSQKEKQKGYVV
jgi:hypothetical protein